MLTMLEMMIVQNLVSNTSAAEKLLSGNDREAEKHLYISLGLQVSYLKQMSDYLGKLPDITFAELIHEISEYRVKTELSKSEGLEFVFDRDLVDFMNRVEKEVYLKNLTTKSTRRYYRWDFIVNLSTPRVILTLCGLKK